MKLKLISCILLFSTIFAFANELDLNDFEEEYQSYKVNDPLYGYNKAMTSFNVALYDYSLRPILKGYNAITPEFIRTGVRNFFDNLFAPLRFVGNVLQFKFEEAGEEFKRFSANTIMGFGGIMDPASKMGLKKHPADLGTVLAHWGVGSGFHIVLPILGPSNLRDTLTLPATWYTSPTAYIDPTWASIAISAYGFGNELSFRLDEIDEIYYNTPNLYPFIRDAYEQRRNELSK
ncbi:MlaA family lipoprotein [Campylobacter coli]|uniref:VacJ family lipoprotein n=1 Tax=Campylobacter coli TaxID=195 RepID=A0A6C7TA19_CAMCO|nr:VacJ family lipoprotein [Campylobacter coli]ECB9808266.1 VacJ family lipoprotein [Campylobacter coli]ECL2218666.1 VacJ family lipoprotein [Campylobacter coli]ECL3739057.1 VacJ family lipoprotein [Campylobacter coli]ECL6486768.1 VacJ family lipoprotein [Campylobacter coli]ECO2983563.1 VacJ family lipoprotein [Campylobacter coli]